MRILLVDDHDLFRSGLRSLLEEEEDFDIVEAENGDEAVRRARAQPPDVVLMDINMPGTSGIDATRRLGELTPAPPVVMLTIASDDANVLDAVRAGACGYLLKDAQLEEIAAAARAAAAGDATIAPGVAGGLLARLRDVPGDEGVTAGPRHGISLSERERQILRLLADGAENAEIAAKLYLSPSTVKNQVSAILAKLGVANRVQAAVFALRHGLLDEHGGSTD